MPLFTRIDTALYIIIDEEWPALKAVLESWLEPDNFDKEGKQTRILAG